MLGFGYCLMVSLHHFALCFTLSMSLMGSYTKDESSFSSLSRTRKQMNLKWITKVRRQTSWLLKSSAEQMKQHWDAIETVQFLHCAHNFTPSKDYPEKSQMVARAGLEQRITKSKFYCPYHLFLNEERELQDSFHSSCRVLVGATEFLQWTCGYSVNRRAPLHWNQ